MQATGKWIISDDILMCEDKDQMDVFADTVIREQSYVIIYLQFSFQLRFYLLVWKKANTAFFSYSKIKTNAYYFPLLIIQTTKC